MNHPAGPLTAKTDGPKSAEEGFRFLGYDFYSEDGSPFARPLARHISTFVEKVNCFISTEDLLDDEALYEGMKYINLWCNGFKAWSLVDVVRVKAELALLSSRFTPG